MPLDNVTTAISDTPRQMSATPFAARGIRFEDISIASFGSPLSVAAPTSIDYLNAQLVAHGFTHGAGLNLADLRGREQQDVLKCLSNMLGQRLVCTRRVAALLSGGPTRFAAISLINYFTLTNADDLLPLG